MRNSKHLTVLASVAVIFIIATIFSESTNNEISGSGNLLYPNLLDQANEITAIKIQRNAGELNLTRKNDLWHVTENNDYPADIDTVRKLVLGLGELVRIEPKTQKPENYAQIGLQDVSENDSPAVRVTLNVGSESNSAIADVYIGNNKASHNDPTKKSYYVRPATDPQSWLVDGDLPDKWEAKDWLDINIFEIDRARIKQVVVDHTDGEKVYIHRAAPSVRDFTLDSLKPGEKVTAPFEVNNIATTFTKMTFDDVVSMKTSDTEPAPAYTATLTTFDGLVITFQPYKKGDIHLVKYQASVDKEMLESTVKDDTSTTETKIEEPKTADTKPLPAPVKLLSADEVNQEVTKYNAVWQGWLYQLPEFRIKNIGKKKADLLKSDTRPIH